MTVLLITAASFALFTGVVLVAYYTVTAETPVERRLRELGPLREKRRTRDAQPGLITQPLAALGRFSMGGGSEGSLRQSLSAAGFRSANAVALFLGIRTVLSFGPALIYLVPQVSSGKPLGRAMMTAAWLWAAGHVLVNSVIRRAPAASA